jgi:hypothetical protein
VIHAANAASQDQEIPMTLVAQRCTKPFVLTVATPAEFRFSHLVSDRCTAVIVLKNTVMEMTVAASEIVHEADLVSHDFPNNAAFHLNEAPPVMSIKS